MKPCLACLAVLMGSLSVGETLRGAEKPAQRTRDVIYGRRDGLALTMDVFTPAGKANGAALVLVVSAGFRSSPESIAPVFHSEFLKRGYTIFHVVPGSAPRYTVPEMHDDVCRAVRYIRHHHKKYGIDPKRIGSGGASSGGLLALLLATSPRPADPNAADPVDREDSAIQASACFFPPTDFLNYGAKGKEFVKLQDHQVSFRSAFDFRTFDPKEGTFQRITDVDQIRARYREISPIYHITAKTPPILLIHGKKDELVPIQQSRSFIDKLKEAKVPAQLVERDAGHGWGTILSDMPAMADWYDKNLGEEKLPQKK
jgi:acetyl esterase/lipase